MLLLATDAKRITTGLGKKHFLMSNNNVVQQSFFTGWAKKHKLQKKFQIIDCQQNIIVTVLIAYNSAMYNMIH